MDCERTHRQLLNAEQLVAKAESYVVLARRAIYCARDRPSVTINAEEVLKRMEAMLEDDIEKRDRLKDQLRLLTH
jgi:hypothetical protein